MESAWSVPINQFFFKADLVLSKALLQDRFFLPITYYIRENKAQFFALYTV
jgi:hypothetical protein